MQIRVAGEPSLVPFNCVLEHILRSRILPLAYAIAVNGKFIPKSHYATYQLQPEDIVAILTPMQGG